MPRPVRSLLCLVWVLLALTGVAFAQEAENRHALVIGNAEYQLGNLRNPLNDARSMAAVLLETGFRTTVIENADKAAMIAAARARGFSPADDNEADAIAILFWALETKGGLQ